MVMSRTAGTLIASAAIVLTGGVAHAPGHTTTGADDPGTFINEAAVLDAGRVVSTVEHRERTPMELAEEYAARNGLTCRSPEAAELDDVVLAVAVHPVDGLPYSDKVHVLSFDQALDSAGKFVNQLACDTP